MKLSQHTSRRIFQICALLLVLVSLVLIVGVIPSIEAEVLRGGTPEKAVFAFWVNIGITVLSAISIFFAVFKLKGRSLSSTTVILGIIVILMGLALSDAASSYLDHGPEMEFASILLFICAAVDVLTGILLIITAILFPKKT
jgi:FtsH-binding integral membrane protein